MPKETWSAEELDEVLRKTTAFRSMGDLVESMRGVDGYGQGYVPTLRPDCYPDYEEGLHAVRAEAQRLGFSVFPDDNAFERREPDAADVVEMDRPEVEEGEGHARDLTLEDLVLASDEEPEL